MERWYKKGAQLPLQSEVYSVHKQERLGTDPEGEDGPLTPVGSDTAVSDDFGVPYNTIACGDMRSSTDPNGASRSTQVSASEVRAESFRANDLSDLRQPSPDVRRVPASNWQPRTAPVPRNADDEAMLRRGANGFIPDNLVIDDGQFFAPETKYASQDLYKGMEREIAHNEGHPGFAAAQASIAAKSGVPMKNAGAILASASRGASKAAKKANPRLNRVQG